VNGFRGVYFRTSGGDTVRLHDCICWRHLEGRPCRTTQECQVAEFTDVVIVPVPPAGCRNIKRACKGCATQVPCSAISSNASPSGAGAGSNPNVDQDVLLRWCAAVRATLEAGGLRTTVDDCPRQTPGAKYHAWENRGVGMRVEVGIREAASGTTCLAIHPRLTHLMPLATWAADLAAAPMMPDWGAAEDNADGPVSSRQSPAKGSNDTVATVAPTDSNGAGGGGVSTGISLRLRGLSLTALVAACRAVAAGQNQGAAATTVVITTNSPLTLANAEPGRCSSISPSGTAAAVSAVATKSQWCRKLHLWPELLAARGSTESAIAALVAELSEAAEAAGPGVAGTGDTAARGSRRAGASASGRPCVAHVRHLLQLGRPCYCGRGHYSLLELQQEVEKRLQGNNLGSRDESQQSHSVVTWIAPAPLPTAAGSKSRVQQGHFGATSACGMQDLKRQDGEVQRPESQNGGLGLCGALSADSEMAAAETAAAAAAEYGEVDFGSGSEESDGGGGGNSGRRTGDRIVLLVGNIPWAVKASAVQTALAAAFAPFGCCGVAVSRTRSGGSHGWSRVTLVAEDSTQTMAAAAAAIAALDTKLRLGGAFLTVSYSSGRLDTIFPYLPYVVRSALRVDSTAAFSATDQATADKMTDLLAGLADRLLRTDWQPSGWEGPGPTMQRAMAGVGVAAAAATFNLGLPQPVVPTGSELLPLVLTDGTACCGGNALSFARRFQRVVAVELDPDRAEDLRHNVALVRAWDAFRCGQLASAAASATPPPGSSSQEPSMPLAPFSSKPNNAADESFDDTSPRHVMGSEPASFCGGADVARGLPTATWRSTGEGALGTLEVRCGDYTELMGLIRQDVVFMDPPWGGPQYCGSARKATRQAGKADCGRPSGLPTVAVAPQNGSDGGWKANYSDMVFTLGNRPLSYMVTELLVNGGARMVALKLPSRSDAELRSMQARIRQLVTARLLESGASGGAGGGDADGTSPELLGAEVTLGRSALVVFLLLPYRRCREGAEGVGAAAASGIADSWKGGVGSGSTFRTALRELCSQLKLAYRLFCE
ncbi:hypothetical protein VaNZ11_003661, partial [Volvox africanus]